MTQTRSVLTQDLITRLIARPRGEEPVVSLYMLASGGDRRKILKSLVQQGDASIEADTGWDTARKRDARAVLERARAEAERQLDDARGGASVVAFAVFADAQKVETVGLPLAIRDRVMVDRTPYASPLSSLLDQYDRFGVVFCNQKRARLFEVYLGAIHDEETLESDHQRSRSAPAGGPARAAGGGGGFHGLEELRRDNHADYVLHRHLQAVADRAFRRFKLRPYDRLILSGPKEVIPKLEEHLHSYLKQRVVAREHLPVDLPSEKARKKILEVEARVEEQKERQLLKEIQDRHGKRGLASMGLDESLRSLFYGKVKTLVVATDDAIPGRECPECHYLFEWPEDERETTPTLVECPVCKRPTRRVPDLVDEAVELAILSGARVQHVAYAKEELRDMGGMGALLRFK